LRIALPLGCADSSLLPWYGWRVAGHWHAHQGCKYAKTPATRTEFWTTKLQGNVDRDRRAADALAEMGWRVLIVWECSTRDQVAAKGLAEALRAWIDSGEATGDISAHSLAAAGQS
jgi:DNA mismatch endonuclease (patch repair protein)